MDEERLRELRLPTNEAAAEDCIRKCIRERYGSAVIDLKTQGVFKSPNLLGFVTVYEADSKRVLISLAESNNFLGVINEDGEFERINKLKITRYIMWSLEKMCDRDAWNSQMRRVILDLFR